jgi:membrane associated rhomboid family serine protease
MAQCPVCNVHLLTVRQREGIYFYCEKCNGRAVTVPQVRRVAGDRFAGQLLREINRAAKPSGRACPFCLEPMKEFQKTDPALTLDACRPCGVVWFDPDEFEHIPEGGTESFEALVLRGREAMAAEKVRQIRDRAESEDVAPEESWKWVAGFFGVPVEMDTPGVTRVPWLTWLTASLILVVSVAAFFNLERAVQLFGLIPAEPWRYGGFTFISSFFLHAGIGHLIGNLYFFLIFADDVEEYLGRWRFACLLALSSFGGDVLAILLDHRSTMPSIGASGGISGILVFYALEFPRARLAFMVFLRWLVIPAWVALVAWMVLQLVTAFQQMTGTTDVSGLAHLGGAGIGFAWWLIWGSSMKPRAEAN